MKIALLGGTGNVGGGLALRWARNHEIIIGSRGREKAEGAADNYTKQLAEKHIPCNILGCDNATAIKRANVVVLSIPYEHVISTIDKTRESFRDKIVITPVVPMKKADGYFIYTPPKEGSAAVEVKNALPESTKVVSIYHSIPSEKLADLDKVLEYDVIICGDDENAKHVVSDLTKEIKNLRPLDGGPLAVSSMVEAMTPLLMNIMIKNRLKNPSIKFL
ncbi:MAG: NADPH-dependent F420 reductase [Candidatus Hydrothermarchaeales archaeon]